MNCHTTNISEYVDKHLQPHVRHYVQDTTDLINKTKNINIPDNSILVTMDVSSLYTNIPNEEGIKAVEETLNKAQTKSIATIVITTLLMLILTLNNFVFNNKFFLQIKGCAMGTKCAPNYTNIFMRRFEEKFIYPKINGLSILYLKYIDDIFLVWTSSKESLQSFLQSINQQHPSIKFEAQMSNKEINFLDTTIYIKNNHLLTKLYSKPTDRQSYLHNNSYHPNATKRGIPFSQALRMKRICSEMSELTINLNTLKSTLKSHGYHECTIQTQFDKVLYQYHVTTFNC